MSARARRPGLLAFGLAVVLVGGGAAGAAEPSRPSEDEMFGSAPAPAAPQAPADAGTTPVPPAAAQSNALSPAAPPLAAPGVPTAADQGSSRDNELLGDPNAGPRLSQDVAPDDPLKIGGQLYLRSLAQATQGQSADSIRFSAPSLMDGYFDARPNDRVRGFVLGRLFFDPTLPTSASATPMTSSSATASMTSSSASVTAPAVPLLSGSLNARGPTMLLDQMWLRFDILHTVFITAGRQHVKWGTARFWTPTDFLHPQPINPIAAFDARPGFTMLKAHIPWESRGWNFYGFGLVEGVQQIDANGRPITGSDGAGTLGQLGTAARAEIVLGAAELGLDTVLYRGRKPKFGGDLSVGVGDFDLYADVGLRYGSELPRRGYVAADVPYTYNPSRPFQDQLNEWVDLKYPVYYNIGVKPQITVGGTYSLKYNDNDVFTVTGEYFYNSLGYDDPHVYPGLFLSNSFQFFYTGRHYAALSAIAAAPYSWNYTTFTLTTLGNLSDQSFITRLDYSLVLLTHLRFEAFGAVDYGHRVGEFRLGVNGFTLPDGSSLSLSPQSFSMGVGLRVSI
ncbi:MAG TPA: hypothetical protein VGP07_08810 [Polyangia bacterium]